jgi:hypothetical protein
VEGGRWPIHPNCGKEVTNSELWKESFCEGCSDKAVVGGMIFGGWERDVVEKVVDRSNKTDSFHVTVAGEENGPVILLASLTGMSKK